MEAEALAFRSLAERCRRLPNSNCNSKVTADLDAQARALDQCAAGLGSYPIRNSNGRGEQHSGVR
jgi:hypothetical protein